ncbi:MAG: HAD family hydrolase [Ruminococcus sp.]|nr:HAD family hydrolase [Ruminococcus sp.]
MNKNYLFDLDGTLLPMPDVQPFVELYLCSLCKELVPVLELSPETLINSIWSGTFAMLKNTGERQNCEVFWEAASKTAGKNLAEYSTHFDSYYKNSFSQAKAATGVTPFAQKSVSRIKENGGRIILATNPVFPPEATHARIRWAGLSPEDFDYITVYDNSRFCKPNPSYYEEICSKCGIKPEESIMIGNDVDEDMCAAKLGFNSYLITDCLINKNNADISEYKNGSFEDFYKLLESGEV